MTQPPRLPPRVFDPALIAPPQPDASEKPKRERPLKYRQRRFVEEFLIDLNATQAAIRAGYRSRSAHTNAHYLLRNPRIAGAVRAEMDARTERTRVSADRVLLEFARLAFSDIGRMLDWTGDTVVLKPPGLIPIEDRAAIAEVALVLHEKRVAARVKLHDKQRALESLARHLGLYGRFAAGAPGTVESPAVAAERMRAKIRERLMALHEDRLAEQSAALARLAPPPADAEDEDAMAED